jgi:hypothetical protein
VVGPAFNGELGYDFTGRTTVIQVSDPDNPGSFLCHAAFDGKGDPVFFDPDRGAVEAHGQRYGLTPIGAISIDPLTGNYVRL